MSLFTPKQMAKIQDIAAHSKLRETNKVTYKKSTGSDLQRISEEVKAYFKDSQAILITTKEQLHEYVDNVIKAGIAGIDTETTGLDRIKDTLVGASLYYPGGVECYIPMKHLVPIFDEPYSNQLTYQEVGEEFERIRQAKVKLIFANADFDLSMIYKDLKVDFNDNFYYDVILAWRVLKENEKDNALKVLYMKYVLKGDTKNAKKFSDFFTPELFPYAKPEVAALYAANDAKITYELFIWQLPYTLPDDPKCQKNHLEKLGKIIWGLEFPLVPVMQNLHRVGIYYDKVTGQVLVQRYHAMLEKEMQKLAGMIDRLLAQSVITTTTKRPFTCGADFSPTSPPQVQYVIYDLLHVPEGRDGRSTSKEVLAEINDPVVKQILAVRSLKTNINSFVDKLPRIVAKDKRIHPTFKSIGADCITGNSIVITPNGFYDIQDLCKEAESAPGEMIDKNIDILNKDCKTETTSGVIYFHNETTVKVTLENGMVIEGTPHHPIVVINSDDTENFKTLETLITEDKVKLPLNYANILDNVEYQYDDNNIKVDENYAFNLGENYKNDAYESPQIPDYIYKSPLTVINAYIRGLSKTSSYFYQRKGTKYAFTLTNFTLNTEDKNFIAVALLSQGIVSDITTGTLALSTLNYFRYAMLIGINEHSQASKYKDPKAEEYEQEVWNEFVNSKDTSLFYTTSKVIRIEESKNDVYDLSVPETHSFIANGVVNHNTGRMSSAFPNLQNIPSKHTDIRHSFRATPEQEQKLESENLEFEIAKYWYLTTIDGRDIEAKDAGNCTENDVFSLSQDDTRAQTKVVVDHIEDISNDNSKIKIVFREVM